MRECENGVWVVVAARNLMRGRYVEGINRKRQLDFVYH